MTPDSRPDDSYFRSIIEAASDLVLVLDAHGLVEYANPAVLRILQHAPDDILGTAVLGHIHPEDVPAAERALREEYEGRNEFPVLDVRARAKDGTWVPMEGKVWLQPGISPPRLAIIARDMRVRRLADRVLTERDAWAHAVLDASPIAIVTLDDRLRVLEWNATAERTYGWRAEEVRGRVHPGVQTVGEDIATLRDLLNAPRGVVDQTASRRRRDGSVFDAGVAIAPLRRLDGTVAGLVEISADLTAQRAVARRFERAQRMEATSRIASGVARDLERLLGALDTGLEDLRGGRAEPARLATLSQEIDRARALTQQLRELGAVAPRASGDAALDEVIAGLAAETRAAAPALTLRLELGAPECRVPLDAERLRGIIAALLANAREAAGNAGSVTIRSVERQLGEEEAGHLGVRAGHYLCVEISDSGSEVPLSVLDRAFEPFFTTKDPTRHRGLGLPRVQAAVRRLGGAITLEHGFTRNVVATLFLPGGGTDAAEPPSVTDAAGRPRAVVLDEQPAIRAQLQRVLTGEGYRVQVAARVADVVALAEARDAALLVAPLVLAAGTGRELAQRLRSLHPDLRVLYTTASSGAGIGPMGARDALLTLPFTDGDLRTAVQLLRLLT